jgi:catechol 2,3-dioxygenase-like lactoylglutathione lyase family enzyme
MKFEFSPHVAFDVTRYEKAIQFYTGVLGMELVKKDDEEAELRSNGFSFHITHRDAFNTYFEFNVEDAEAARELLEANGCSSIETLTPEGETSYLITDPYGMNFQIWPKPGK